MPAKETLQRSANLDLEALLPSTALQLIPTIFMVATQQVPGWSSLVEVVLLA